MIGKLAPPHGFCEAAHEMHLALICLRTSRSTLKVHFNGLPPRTGQLRLQLIDRPNRAEIARLQRDVEANVTELKTIDLDSGRPVLTSISENWT